MRSHLNVDQDIYERKTADEDQLSLNERINQQVDTEHIDARSQMALNSDLIAQSKPVNSSTKQSAACKNLNTID